MSEPTGEYNAQPDDCHAHSHDDNHGVDFWRRAPVTDAQYRRVLAERAILQEQVKELQAYADKLAAGLPVGMLPQDVDNLRRANEQFAVDVDALTLQLKEMSDAEFDARTRLADLVISGTIVYYNGKKSPITNVSTGAFDRAVEYLKVYPDKANHEA